MANTLANLATTGGALFTTYRKHIMIGVAILVVIYFIYRWAYPSSGYQENYQEYPESYEDYQENYQDQNQDPEQPTEPSDQTTETTEAFSSSQKKLVLFALPWCPHCVELTKNENSPWTRLERKHGKRADVKIEKIDCEKNPEMATKYGIGGFPSIKMIKGGEVIDYDGDRSFESFEEFLNTA